MTWDPYTINKSQLLGAATDTLTLPVDFDIYITDQDFESGRPWPPDRYATRNQRLDILDRLGRGDLTCLEGYKRSDTPVEPNLFAYYSDRLCDLLLMNPPVAAGFDDAFQETLVKVAYDGLRDMGQYGGTILAVVGDGLAAYHPSRWYPARDGDYIIQVIQPDGPDEGSDEGSDKRTLRVWFFSDEDTVTETVYAVDGNAVGAQRSSSSLGAGALTVVPKRPCVGIWGTSKYLGMATLVREIARQESSSARTLALSGRPIPVIEESDMDARDRFDVPTTDTDARAEAKIIEGYTDMLLQDFVRLVDCGLKLSYAQPDVSGVTVGQAQVGQILDLWRDFASLPDMAATADMTATEARLQFLSFWAETQADLNMLRSALSGLVGVEIVWPHLFESDLFTEEAIMMIAGDPPPVPAMVAADG